MAVTDLTTGSPLKKILGFAAPLIIGATFQQLYLFTDAAVVGRLVGVNGVAAIGCASSLVFLSIGFAIGATAGFAIPVANEFGAGNLAAMRRNVTAGAMVAAAATAVIVGCGTLGAGWLLALMHAPVELEGLAKPFLVVTFAGGAAMVAFNFLAATVRAVGNSRTPLVFWVLCSVLNAGLAFAFVGGLGIGVPGAAAATVTAHALTTTAFYFWVRWRTPELRLTRADWRAGRSHLAALARAGLPLGLQSSIIAVGTVSLQAAVNQLGTEATAAYTVSLRIEQWACALFGAFGAATMVFVAQNRGAQQWVRIRLGVRSALTTCLASAVVLGVLLLVGYQSVVGWFLGHEVTEVHLMAHRFVLINASVWILLALVFLVRAAVQGMGKASAPTLAAVFETVARVLAVALLVRSFGFVGAAVAGPVAWAGSLLATVPVWLKQRRLMLACEPSHVTGASSPTLPGRSARLTARSRCAAPG